jgi:hypothetical protein
VYFYSFLTSALDGGGCSTPRPSHITLGEGPGAHCTGGRLATRASPDVESRNDDDAAPPHITCVRKDFISKTASLFMEEQLKVKQSHYRP